jgi:hypothetical protein
MSDERTREIAQWYMAGGSAEMDGFSMLPEAVRKRCFQFGQLVGWQRLPVEAQAACGARLDAIRAQADRHAQTEAELEAYVKDVSAAYEERTGRRKAARSRSETGNV